MSFDRWRSLVDGAEIDVGSAIPDSAVLHYPFLERTTNSIVEVLEGSDGEVDGDVDNISNTWWQGYAEQHDGGLIWLDELNEWAENLSGTSGFAITVETNNDGHIFGGRFNGDSPPVWAVSIGTDDGFAEAGSSGDVAFTIRDGLGNSIESWSGDLNASDGNRHRIFTRKTGTTSEDIEIWVDGTELSLSFDGEDTLDDTEFNSFTDEVPFFDNSSETGRSVRGDPLSGGVLDNAVFYEDPTEDDIANDYNVQPWS